MKAGHMHKQILHICEICVQHDIWIPYSVVASKRETQEPDNLHDDYVVANIKDYQIVGIFYRIVRCLILVRGISAVTREIYL